MPGGSATSKYFGFLYIFGLIIKKKKKYDIYLRHAFFPLKFSPFNWVELAVLQK